MGKVGWAALPLVLVASMAVGCTPVVPATPFDVDGDGRADRVVIDLNDGRWASIDAGHPFVYQGQAGDLPVPGDYDGDGRIDVVVVRGADWVRSDGAIVAHLPPPTVDTFGVPSGPSQPHALPVPGDYDGDGRTEPAWFQEDTATWTFADGHTMVWGHGPTDPHGCCLVNNDADVPVPADYDGDGHTDLAVANPVTGRWLIRSSADGSTRTVAMVGHVAVGVSAFPIPADFDGDGRADPTLFTSFGWSVAGQSDFGFVPPATFGHLMALPAPADYDGVGHDRQSFLTDDGSWPIAGRWTVAGLEPAHVAGPPSGSLRYLPISYPYRLLATYARIDLVQKNFWACDTHILQPADCIEPS